MRQARISKKSTTKSQLERYLPSNYEFIGEDSEFYYIGGNDRMGWTLDDYVIPRLQSGLIFAEEIPVEDVAR
jgi:hypothetical protein